MLGWLECARWVFVVLLGEHLGQLGELQLLGEHRSLGELQSLGALQW